MRLIPTYIRPPRRRRGGTVEHDEAGEGTVGWGECDLQLSQNQITNALCFDRERSDTGSLICAFGTSYSNQMSRSKKVEIN